MSEAHSRIERSRAVGWIASLAIAAILAGCGAPAPDGSTSEPSGPSWVADLPASPADLTDGQQVWAVVPVLGSEAARLVTYRASVTEAGAALVDSLGNRFEEVPAGLVHMLPEGSELAVGMPVLASRWDTGPVVGRVASLEGAAVTVSHDWNGVTVSNVMDRIVPLTAKDESPLLRWVAYSEGEGTAWRKGLCFAQHDGRLWLTDGSGYATIVAQDAANVLTDLGQLEPAVGDRVFAYTSGAGFRAGAVTEVLEPNLRYAVALDDGESLAVFFSELTQML
ncbi:MAG: hypothetical protein AAF560_31210 [Acidobacteriota bacterium]